MLNVYGAKWCPHCTDTIRYLEANNIDFDYFEIENEPQQTVQKIIEVNGGDDWVVPTLEFNGKWRKGKIYIEKELKSDLRKWGLI